jgi:hypothetical protein
VQSGTDLTPKSLPKQSATLMFLEGRTDEESAVQRRADHRGVNLTFAVRGFCTA